jgi:radical SAM protein with 4Fe4S-binding SPASM domain
MHCPLPSKEFQVKPNGDVYPCCEDWLPTPIGNILEDSWEKIWNGDVASEIRAATSRGDFRFCTRCPYLPGPAGPIMASGNPPKHEHPHTLRIDYLRTCNLACRSCRTSRVDPSPEPSRVHEAVLRQGLLDVVHRICASGAGDPVADPECWDMLQNLHVLAPKNPDVEVCLYTNGLLLDERRWAELNPRGVNIKEVGISVDAATEKTYTELRGGSWQKLWHNVDLARWMSSEEKRFAVVLYFVLQAANFRELSPLMKLARRLDLDFVQVFFLRNWGTYGNEEYRRRAVHLPEHPEHRELARELASLSKDPMVVLPTFPPRHFK